MNKLFYLRKSQLDLNRLIKSNVFDFPIHLALGAEGISIILKRLKKRGDYLILNHRNIHHNLLYCNYQEILIKFLDKKNKNKLGSMNLNCVKENLIYTSSILANASSIATGIATEAKINCKNHKTFITIGDGAIEEGSFYESLNIAGYLRLPIIYVIEDNGYSMSSSIESRRINFDIEGLATLFKIDYIRINNENLNKFYNLSLNYNFLNPTILHFKYKLYCNHAGTTPGWSNDSKNLDVDDNLIFNDFENDPLYLLKNEI